MTKIFLFVGTQEGYEVLSWFQKNKYNICGVLGLDQQSHEIDSYNYSKKIKNFCVKNKLLYKSSSEIKPQGYFAFLNELKPDLVFIVDWRFLIPEKAFNIPSLGMFILHGSLLPKYRGFAPINWAIINGEKETALTLLYIDKEVDRGDIVDQIKIKIDPKETATTLKDKFLKTYPRIMVKNVEQIISGKNKKIKQNESKATYACKRIPEDGHIDFNQDTKKILRLIRGLSFPYPGAFCFLKGKKIIIWEAEEIQHPPVYVGKIPGRPVKISDTYVDILTRDSVLRVKKISLAETPSIFLTPNTLLNTIAQSVL